MLGAKDIEILFKPMFKRALKRKRPKPKKVKKQKKVESSQEQPVVDEDNKEAGDEEQDNGEEEQGNEEAVQDNAVDAEEEQAAEEEGKEEEEEEEEEPEAEAEGEEDEDEKPKLENFAPESVIFFEKENKDFKFYDDTKDERKENIQAYFDVLRTETLTVDLTKVDTYEGMEDLRLYVERVSHRLLRTIVQITT